MNTQRKAKSVDDREWGCVHTEHINKDDNLKIKPCFITIENLNHIAEKLAESVLDDSWILELDDIAQLSYAHTVKETANDLVKVFKKASETKNIGTEFGEVMVSIGSSRALSEIFNHQIIPIAELWKPKRRGNEGFDFHTICPKNIINFGEAKFSTITNPYSDSINQTKDFITEKKHLRDLVHLEKIAHNNAIDNIKENKFGAIAAFSINSEHYENIMENAIEKVKLSDLIDSVEFIYLVGVICKV